MMSQGKVSIERNILEQFWTLAESDEQGILSSTESLSRQLAKKQEDSEIEGETCRELKYSIDRLVKGLASSRQSARHGFLVALCQILRNFSIVTVDAVLEAVAKQLKYTQKESKSEQGNILLGKTLAYLALIQSGRLCQNQESQLQKVTKHLLEIKKKRSYLQQICTNAISLAISQVDSETFKGYIYPEIESDVIQGWDPCTPDSFLLLLSCYTHQSETVNKKFLKQHWQCSKLICKDNFERLWKIIMQTASCYPVRHIVVDQIVHRILETPSYIAEFWSSGVDLMFGKAVSNASIGLHILLKVLPCVKSLEQVNSILVPSVLDTLTKAVDSKKKSDHPLFTVAKETIEVLTLTIKQCTDGDIQLAVLRCLEASSTTMGREMSAIKDAVFQSLMPDAAESYSQHLLKAFYKLSKQNEDEENDVKIIKLITDIRSLVSLQSMSAESDWQLHILKFLAVHSYWNVTQKIPDIAHCEKETKTLSTAVRKQFQDSLFRALDNLLVHKGEISKSMAINNYIDKVYQLSMYMTELTERETCVAWGTKMQEKVLEHWDSSLGVISNIKEKLTPEDSSGVHQCLALLILYHCMQLLTEPKNNFSVLEDLTVCHNKITKVKGRKSSKQEPKWIEVIMEVLLSMMSHRSNLARVIAKTAFGQVCEHVTRDSLKLITEVLDSDKLGGDDDGLLGYEDEEDMEDEEEDEDENNDEIENGMDVDEDEKGKKEEIDDDSESSSEEEEDEEEDEVDETLRNAVRTALGDAAANEDDDEDENEDDSDDDLSDSEMFKHDAALAAVFRETRRWKEKSKAELRKQLGTFKIRVLDLVEVLVKNHPKGDLVMDLIFPLLRLVMSLERDKEQREIGHKAESILKHLYKKAEVHGQASLEKERYIEGFKEAIEMSTKVSGNQFVLCVSNAALLMVRLVLNIETESTGPSPVKTRSQRINTEKISTEEQVQKDKDDAQQEVLEVIGKRLTDLVHKNDSRLHQGFFENMFIRYPVLFWPMTDILLKAVMDTDIKVFGRTQAVSLLIPLVNKETASHVGEESWSTFTDKLMSLLSKVMKDTKKDTYKPQLVRSTYQVINKRLNIAEDFKACSDDILDLMESLKKCYNKDTKKLCNRIVGKLRQLDKTSSSMSKKTAKKRGPEANSNGAVKKERLK